MPSALTTQTSCWASDGRIYFVSDRGGTECVWSVHADDPNNKTMTADAAHEKDHGAPAHGKEAKPDPFESAADTRDVQH